MKLKHSNGKLFLQKKLRSPHLKKNKYKRYSISIRYNIQIQNNMPIIANRQIQNNIMDQYIPETLNFTNRRPNRPIVSILVNAKYSIENLFLFISNTLSKTGDYLFGSYESNLVIPNSVIPEPIPTPQIPTVIITPRQDLFITRPRLRPRPRNIEILDIGGGSYISRGLLEDRSARRQFFQGIDQAFNHTQEIQNRHNRQQILQEVDQYIQNQTMNTQVTPGFIETNEQTQEFLEPVRVPLHSGFENIPTIKYDGQCNTECSICFNEFQLGEKLKRLGCFHQYHFSCIKPWLESYSTKCPSCRYDQRNG